MKAGALKEGFFVNTLLKWAESHTRVFPWRLNRTPYHVFVAEFLLQRTPADRVAGIYSRLLEEVPTIDDLAKANPYGLEQIGRSLGLIKRMHRLVNAAREIVRSHESHIPNSIEELQELPGIGGYTAAAIVCFGFGRDVAIIDANVKRVLSRYFEFNVKYPKDLEALNLCAARLIPTGRGLSYNDALLDFAAIICRKNPQCTRCPLNLCCSYYQGLSESRLTTGRASKS